LNPYWGKRKVVVLKTCMHRGEGKLFHEKRKKKGSIFGLAQQGMDE